MAIKNEGLFFKIIDHPDNDIIGNRGLSRLELDFPLAYYITAYTDARNFGDNSHPRPPIFSFHTRTQLWSQSLDIILLLTLFLILLMILSFHTHTDLWSKISQPSSTSSSPPIMPSSLSSSLSLPESSE